MRLIKVSEASGAVLDWLVAKCEGIKLTPYGNIEYVVDHLTSEFTPYNPSTNPAQGWPIIDREGINLRSIRKPGHSMDGLWLAKWSDSDTGETVRWYKCQFGDKGQLRRWQGPTSLVAAMRSYAASKLGETVEVPEELFDVA